MKRFSPMTEAALDVWIDEGGQPIPDKPRMARAVHVYVDLARADGIHTWRIWTHAMRRIYALRRRRRAHTRHTTRRNP